MDLRIGPEINKDSAVEKDRAVPLVFHKLFCLMTMSLSDRQTYLVHGVELEIFHQTACPLTQPCIRNKCLYEVTAIDGRPQVKLSICKLGVSGIAVANLAVI